MASIDVVVPCYQYGRFLRDCVTGILGQGIGDLRVLIIDNASTDDSMAVARQLAATDPRIEVLAHERNLGLIASLNEGVDWAKADYFAIVHADDLLTPGSFMRAMSFMEQHSDVGFAIGNEIVFQQGDALPEVASDTEAQWRILSGAEFVAERCRKLVAAPIVVRTTVQKQAGHYRQAFFHICDMEMLLRLATFGMVGETTAPQGYRRWHGANLANVHRIDRLRMLGEYEAAFADFFANAGRSLARAPQLEQRARRNLLERAYWRGVRDLTQGHWRTGIGFLRFALARSPQLAVLPPIGFILERAQPLRRLVQAAQRIFRSRGQMSKSL
jgi:glycosyltransferase involved in cell wall biosynthesis